MLKFGNDTATGTNSKVTMVQQAMAHMSSKLNTNVVLDVSTPYMFKFNNSEAPLRAELKGKEYTVTDWANIPEDVIVYLDGTVSKVDGQNFVPVKNGDKGLRLTLLQGQQEFLTLLNEVQYQGFFFYADYVSKKWYDAKLAFAILKEARKAAADLDIKVTTFDGE